MESTQGCQGGCGMVQHYYHVIVINGVAKWSKPSIPFEMIDGRHYGERWQGRWLSQRKGTRPPSRLKMALGEDSWWWCRCHDEWHRRRMAKEGKAGERGWDHRWCLHQVDLTATTTSWINGTTKEKVWRESHGPAIHRILQKEKKKIVLHCYGMALWTLRTRFLDHMDRGEDKKKKI